MSGFIEKLKENGIRVPEEVLDLVVTYFWTGLTCLTGSASLTDSITYYMDGTIVLTHDYIIRPEPIIHEQINKRLFRSIQYAEEKRKSHSMQRRST